MYHIKECIIVEGVYDKIKLSQIVDGAIFVTHGFSIFNHKKDLETIRTFAKKCGIVIFTDSDAAGFKIRSYIKQSIPKEQVKHAYIPEISGKERRKVKPGKEGILGVEGVDNELLVTALKNAGCILEETPHHKKNIPITKTDFYNIGLSGGSNSVEKRIALCKMIGLPGKISSNMLLDAVNTLMSREDFLELCQEL